MELLNIFNTGSSGGGSGPTMAQIDAEIDRYLAMPIGDAGGLMYELENEIGNGNSTILNAWVENYASQLGYVTLSAVDDEIACNYPGFMTYDALLSYGFDTAAAIEEAISGTYATYNDVDNSIANALATQTVSQADYASDLNGPGIFAVTNGNGYYGVYDSMNSVTVRLGGSTTASKVFEGGFALSGALRPVSMTDTDAMADFNANQGMNDEGKNVPYVYYSMTRHKLCCIDSNPADNTPRVMEL